MSEPETQDGAGDAAAPVRLFTRGYWISLAFSAVTLLLAAVAALIAPHFLPRHAPAAEAPLANSASGAMNPAPTSTRRGPP